MTKQLLQVGNIIDITVQDHVIISTRQYTGMREKKELWEEIVNDIKYKPQYLIEFESKLEEKKQIAS